MTRSLLLAALLALPCVVSAEEAPNEAIEVVAGAGKTPPALCLTSGAEDVLRACRAMLPRRPIELTGALIRRNRKGIVSSEYDYRLTMRRGDDFSLLTIRLFPRGKTDEVASVSISRKANERPVIRLTRGGSAETEIVGSPLARVLDTDVTWLDLTFDFLWWRNAAYETEREGESIHGQTCKVVLVKPEAPIDGLSAVRLWVDKKTGCLMQAEQVGSDGKPARRLWGTRIKKFDGRWMASALEVETSGARYRTKITVENLKDL